MANKKKNNMAMWDAIDGEAEEFVRGVIAMAGINPDNLDEDEVIETYKGLLDYLLPVLKEKFGVEFEYIDENY